MKIKKIIISSAMHKFNYKHPFYPRLHHNKNGSRRLRKRKHPWEKGPSCLRRGESCVPCDLVLSLKHYYVLRSWQNRGTRLLLVTYTLRTPHTDEPVSPLVRKCYLLVVVRTCVPTLLLYLVFVQKMLTSKISHLAKYSSRWLFLGNYKLQEFVCPIVKNRFYTKYFVSIYVCKSKINFSIFEERKKKKKTSFASVEIKLKKFIV